MSGSHAYVTRESWYICLYVGTESVVGIESLLKLTDHMQCMPWPQSRMVCMLNMACMQSACLCRSAVTLLLG